MSFLGEGSSSSSEGSRTPTLGQRSPFIPHVSMRVMDYSGLERIVTRKSKKFHENPNRGEEGHAYYAEGGDSDVYLILWPKDGILGPKRIEVDIDRKYKMEAVFGMPALIRLERLAPFTARVIRNPPHSQKLDFTPTTELSGTILHPATREPLSSKRSAINMAHLESRFPDFPSEFEMIMVNPNPDPDAWGGVTHVKIRDKYNIYAYVTTNPHDVEFLEPIVENMADIYRYYENTRLFYPLLLDIQTMRDQLRIVDYAGGFHPAETLDRIQNLRNKLQDAIAEYRRESEHTREYKISAALLYKYKDFYQ